ncbi:SPFH domain-containing protein [Gynurincola endophyticus]|uniref:SPFH domain-containing protein n=1 Tax=Gynurincola endophyticus TaxID=2479004 RepID=UPI000F8D7A8D|nr:SPFH domain-containing protein [Gynurincola endophyticus]
MEKVFKPISGYLALLVALALLGLSVYFFVNAGIQEKGIFAFYAILSFIVSIFLFKGVMVIHPNHARVCTFFGKYVGSVKENGLLWVNPLYGVSRLSLRAQNLESSQLKVNDMMGNPIEIAAAIVWQVSNTYKATFDVDDYSRYVKVQSEAAIRHLATSCPYEDFDGNNDQLTLRNGGEAVNNLLEQELNERLAPAGIIIREARISHLAYSPEIAGAMLQRQQAHAIVSARAKIVEGAVGMVEMALEQLSKKHIVELDEEKKAAMVSNLMVVLCGEKSAQPVLNTGTLYQ